MPVLVDTNVIIDVVTNDPLWSSWSLAQLRANEADGLVINPVIFAELSCGYGSLAAVEATVAQLGLVRAEIPDLGLFRSAQAFVAYRARGGRRSSVLPDFFIGGHAEAAGLTLLTRDVQRYGTYFPTVQLIVPSA